MFRMPTWFPARGRGSRSRSARGRGSRPEVAALESRQLLATVTTALSVSPTVVWPPNGRVMNVVVSGTFTDVANGQGFNPAALTYRVIDEYGTFSRGSSGSPVLVSQAPGSQITTSADGSTVSFRFLVQVQARRSGFDRDGRTFQVVVNDADNAGNTFVATGTVIVPHDMGHPNGPGGAFNAGRAQGRGGNGRGRGAPVRPVTVPRGPVVVSPGDDAGQPEVEVGGNHRGNGNGNGNGHGNGHGRGRGRG
jgi:hypothetical protein